MPDTTTATLDIIGLGAQGDGIARDGATVVHVPNALPGERATRNGDGTFELSGPASPDRRSEALCPHIGRCGGCTAQHMGDRLYTAWKGGLLAGALEQHGIETPVEPMRSVPVASRRRATFTGAWIDGKPRLGFNAHRSHALEPIAVCAVLHPSIVAAIPHLERLTGHLAPTGRPFRLSVLAADNGLDVGFEPKPTRAAPGKTAAIADLMRKARVTRLTSAGEPLLMLATPLVEIAGVPVTPPPEAFLQATAETDTLLAGAMLPSLAKAKRVYDLFSGLGTLTFPIARRARVTAVDSDAGLLSALADAAAHARGLKPIERLRRDLFRDPMSPRELDSVDAVVLDPPRAGAAAQCQSIARSQVHRVVMVSCNPATMARDLRTLIDGGYTLETAIPIDQFLFTPHLEAVAVLVRT